MEGASHAARTFLIIYLEFMICKANCAIKRYAIGFF